MISEEYPHLKKLRSLTLITPTRVEKMADMAVETPPPTAYLPSHLAQRMKKSFSNCLSQNQQTADHRHRQHHRRQAGYVLGLLLSFLK